jgi:signal transduction histidine kinase/CheY-like chemotaxis protein/CHASE3 domain sensor protein
VVPGAVEMKANTAIGICALSASLWLATRTGIRATRASLGLALAVVALGLATLGQYAFDWNLGIDEAIFADRTIAFNAYRGRMSPYTAGAFVFAGLGVAGLFHPRTRPFVWLATVPVLAVGGVSVFGYVWNAQEIVTDRILPPVALNTAFVLVVFGSGILAAARRPHDPAGTQVAGESGFSLEGQVVASLTIALLVLFIGGGYTYRATVQFDEAIDRLGQTDLVRQAATRLDVAALEAQTAQREYWANRDAKVRARFETAIARVRERHDDLKRTHQAAKVNFALFADVDRSTEAFVRALDGELRDADLDSFLDSPARAASPHLHEQVTTALTRLDEADTALQREQKASASSLRQVTLSTLLATLLIATGFCAYLFRMVQREARLRRERRHQDQRFQRALSLYASTFTRSGVVDGTVGLLAELRTDGAAAFYRRTDAGFELESASPAPSPWPDVLDASRGLGADAVAANGLVQQEIVDGGTTLVRYVAPITYFDRVLGLVAVSTAYPLYATERAYIERLAAKLAIALDNLEHYATLARLSERLTETNDKLREQAAELERANRMKTEFLATMSHELRTPLNAIIGFADVLRDGLAGELAEQQREFVGDIQSSGEHLLALINDILDLSKVEAGKMELDLAATDVRGVLQHALTMVRERATSHRIALSVDDAGLPDEAVVDARKLKQIAYNLLSNAVKFTPDGGAVAMRCRVDHDVARPVLELTVADTGTGIGPEDQKRLFQPFVQIDGSLAKRYEGTGLGLAMVRRLAELHGGSVEVESELGRGSTFTVRLPYRRPDEIALDDPEPPPATVDSAPRAPAPKRKQPLALIIDDEPRQVELLRVQLESLGVSVVHAGTTESALALARSRRPDVITLDVLLANESGWDLLRKLKASEELASIPVIMVSIVADRRRGLALGASGVLEKPIDRRDLAVALSTLQIVAAVPDVIRAVVVDDNERDLALLSAHLESAGCDVRRSRSGEDAVQSCTRDPPDVVVLDLLMPGLSGFDVIERLRSSPRTSALPIVVITAKDLSADERQSLTDVSRAVLAKASAGRASVIHEVREAASRVEER